MYSLKKDKTITRELLKSLMEELPTSQEVTKYLYGTVKSNDTLRIRLQVAVKYFNLEEEYEAFKVKDQKARGINLEVEETFVKDSERSIIVLKSMLSKYELLNTNCLHCGLGKWYNGKEVTLQLDHIDGNNRNNELSNLRYLCPNCHSQTDYYCQNKTKRGNEKKICEGCGVNIIKCKSKICRKCFTNKGS